MIDSRLVRVALLLFGSGACALIYQVAWLRELRLVFGGSTAASAAVLAAFMGGLGLGSAVLGRLADSHPRPLSLYAHLELGVAVSAALTPLLLAFGRLLYVAAGGSAALGGTAATLARLVLSALVLGIPTFLMGGTLPAAVRAVETHADQARRRLAVLYGVNTAGAVTGTLLANFLLLENYGTRSTLLVAALANALVALTARSLSRTLKPASPPDPAAADATVQAAAPPSFVLAAAAIVGFVFLLMELVWFRMLTPLLGGTTFTFGLILAVALAGIGLGGAAYSLVERRPSLLAFATTCALEGLAVAVPFALGDRLVFLAQLLRPLGSFGFVGYVGSWTVVTAIVVLPAAVVAGFQFPLLVALLGAGEKRVARHVGAAYAWNTLGAIGGATAGGFGLLVLVGSSGAWRLAVLISALLGLAAVFLDRRAAGTRRRLPAAAAVVTAILALALASADGPTALWRQSPVGTGRVTLPGSSPNALRQWAHAKRRRTVWEADGWESLVGLSNLDAYAFAINGKIDGNAKADAPTQVMLGLIGAALHPAAEQALVIGLGTGSTAGWLADVPSIERLDVVELEPAIRKVAEVCAPVNRRVLDNPKVRLTFADARELLLTSRESYDLVVSEPSNPHIAGIASLFTREFYAAVADRLTADGLFLQWLQAYEVGGETVETVMRTLAEIYPHVDVWQTSTADLLFVASRQPIPFEVDRLRRRLAQEPFRAALAHAWRTRGVEGFLSRFVARGDLVRAVAATTDAPINTDDRNRVEFGFARSLGAGASFSPDELRELAVARGEHRPRVAAGTVDWQRVVREELMVSFLDGVPPPVKSWHTADQRRLAAAYGRYLNGDLAAALASFRALGREPEGPNELLMVSEALADRGDQAAGPYLERLAEGHPVEATAVRARLALRQGDVEAALVLVEEVFAGLRRDPWVLPQLMDGAMNTAGDLAGRHPPAAPRLVAALSEPFAVLARNDNRLAILLRIAPAAGPQAVVEVMRTLEPDVPWDRFTLMQRLAAYRAVGDPLAVRASDDLAAYLRYQNRPFAGALRRGAATPSAAEPSPDE